MKTATPTATVNKAPRAKKKKAQPIIKTDRQWAEEIFPQIVDTLAGIDEKYATWKKEQLKTAKVGLDRNDKNGLAKILDSLQAFSKEDAERNERENARLAAEAKENARLEALRAPVTGAWADAKEFARLWVMQATADGKQGQKAWDAAFRSDYQKMAEKVSQASYEDWEAVLDLACEIIALTARVSQFKQNWCTICGAPIDSLITPRKGGKSFEPSFCRKDLPAKKWVVRAASEVISVETIQALQTDPQFTGVVVETKRNGEIIGGSATSSSDDEPKPAPEPELPVTGKKKVKGKQTAEEAEDDAQYAETEKIGSKH